MVKAVMSGGEIRPIEPLPTAWREGQRLRVDMEEEVPESAEKIDRSFAILERLCATSDPADEVIMERALREAREQAKEYTRRQMGLK
jgi:hypothetical protein